MQPQAEQPVWQDLERQAYHAYREWHIWLVLRERELRERLASQRRRAEEETDDQHPED